MPVSKPEPTRVPIDEGSHLLTLTSVKETELPSYNDPNKMEVKWLWVFESQKRDAEGKRQQFRVVTGSIYGNPRSTLTTLFDMLIPNASKAEKCNFDTEKIVMQTFEAQIKHEAGATPNDPVKPRFVYMRPYRADAAFVQEPDVDENALAGTPDPFADQ